MLKITTPWSQELVRYNDVDLPTWFDVHLSHPDWPTEAVLSVAVSEDTGPVATGLRAAGRSSSATYRDVQESISATAEVGRVLGRAAALMANTLNQIRVARAFGDEGMQLTPERLSEVLQKVGDLTMSYTQPRVQPQRRRRITRELLREVANVYRKAHSEGEPPTAAVAQHFTIAYSTAARWVGEARKAGELGPATGPTPGEAGEEGAS